MASSNSSTPNINVPIRIEPTDEYKIQEITYDGQEKYIPPLSMTENLSQLISKIDFNQPIDELKEELERDDNDEQAPPSAQQQTAPGSSWPFDSMRTKLRMALTEICVLLDVLLIAKEKKYMMFDAVNPPVHDQRAIVGLLAKKKELVTASQILLDGCSTLRSSATNTGFSSFGRENLSTHPTDEPNFYEELKEMRQNWRLKRIGNNIVGDLSYFRPHNYRFTANSRFEVIRNPPGSEANQALSVKVPADLQGRAHIQVSIVKDDELSLVDLSTSANGRQYEAASDGTWNEKLEAAQNVLFCKELFCHLANQAVQYQFVIPTTVTGNQIILALFPDIKLYITLVHHTPNTKCSREITEGMRKLQREHRPVFEHSLHKMLKDYYANMFRRLQGLDVPNGAGPSAMDKQTLFEATRLDSSLDKLVQQAQHLIMRQQTMEVIEDFATTIKDPLIISHWFCLNSPISSIVRVDVVSHNNEILGRSHMLIYVGTRQLRVITRDCKNLLLGYERNELRHLLVWQSCLHQFIASDKLSKLLGWYTLALNYNVNVSRDDIASTAFSLVICSSNCSHMISIKSGPQFGLAVEVAAFKRTVNSAAATSALAGAANPGLLSNGLSTASINGVPNGHSPSSAGAAVGIGGYDFNDDNSPTSETSIEALLGSAFSGANSGQKLCKLQDLVENFREVDWDKMQGRDFLTKLELLMAALSDVR